MKRLVLTIIILTAFGCSFMYRDKRPFSETSWTIGLAETYRQNIPLDEQVERAEALTFDRFCTGGLLTTELRVKPSDPYGFSGTYVPSGFADASCYSPGALGAMSLRYAWEVREYGAATSKTLAHLDAAFEAVVTLCTFSGVPGLVVRGVRHKNTPYNEKPDQKWYPGRGEYIDYRGRFGASVPQYRITVGLQLCYLLGPEKYKDRIREIIEDICMFLIIHDYQIVDVDGLPTKISEFDPRDSLLLVGSPWTGYLGLYIVWAALPGGRTPYDVMTGNRAALNLLLLQILRFGAIATENPLIRSEYFRLCKEGYAARTRLAGVNFFGIFNAGDEIPKVDSLMCLLWPDWRNALPDQEYQKYYWQCLERIYQWIKDMKCVATAQYCFLKGEKDEERLADLIKMLGTFALPNRRRTIVTSNIPSLRLYGWAQLDKSPEALTINDSILPHLLRKANAEPKHRDPRSGLDSEGDETREFSYMYLLYCYWLLKWCGYI